MNSDLIIDNKTPNALVSVLKCSCPRCRHGKMFKNPNAYRLKTTMRMYEECTICGQSFNPEVGFYYGSGYVSYGLAVAVTVTSLILWILTIGMSTNDYRFLYWLGANAIILLLLQPLLMRLARSIWLSIFVRYEKNWKTNPAAKPERTNETHKNNW